MKRERLEAPAMEANWAAVSKRSASAELTFFATSAQLWHALPQCVYVHARYGQEPFAYMMVQDGVFYDDRVWRNSRCELYKTLGNEAERALFWSLRNQIVAGCTALVEKHWPLALKK